MAGDYICSVCGQYQCVCGNILRNLLRRRYGGRGVRPGLNEHQEKGWECPRCHKINAPWVRECDCPVPVMSNASDTWKDCALTPNENITLINYLSEKDEP